MNLKVCSGPLQLPDLHQAVHAGEEEREHGPHSALQAEGTRGGREQEGPQASGPDPPLRHHPSGVDRLTKQDEPTELHLSERSQQLPTEFISRRLPVFLSDKRGGVCLFDTVSHAALLSVSSESGRAVHTPGPGGRPRLPEGGVPQDPRLQGLQVGKLPLVRHSQTNPS